MRHKEAVIWKKYNSLNDYKNNLKDDNIYTLIASVKMNASVVDYVILRNDKFINVFTNEETDIKDINYYSFIDKEKYESRNYDYVYYYNELEDITKFKGGVYSDAVYIYKPLKLKYRDFKITEDICSKDDSGNNSFKGIDIRYTNNIYVSEFEYYTNGINPIITSTLSKSNESLINKTVVSYEQIQYGKYAIICFNDNRFIILANAEDLRSQQYSSNSVIISGPTSYRISESFSIDPSLIIKEDDDSYGYSSKYKNIEDTIKITKFGKWLHENTDIDVVSYYQDVIKYYKEDREAREKYDKEQKLKQYNRLKKELGL